MSGLVAMCVFMPSCTRGVPLNSTSPVARNVNRLVRSPDRTGRRSAVWIRPISHHRDIAFGNRLFQSLVFTFADEHGQLLRLQVKTGVDHFHVAVENADVLVRIEESIVRVNFGCGSVRSIQRRAICSVNFFCFFCSPAAGEDAFDAAGLFCPWSCAPKNRAKISPAAVDLLMARGSAV